jgi:hypothetical protein
LGYFGEKSIVKMKKTFSPWIWLMLVAGWLLSAGAVYAHSEDFNIDDAKVADAGIHKLSGKHLTIYTDLTGPEIDILPTVFDQAFSQWCKYFQIKEDEHDDWHMTCMLMKDKSLFTKAGLLPDTLPEFKFGYSQSHVMWLNEQPSDYYRRHLLLHEGTHGFMFSMLGSCGPFWYMEGIAEYLGTHRWKDGQLALGYMPRDRKEVPEWGRVRLIQNAVAQHKGERLKTVIDSTSNGLNDLDSYAWRWAAVTLLDQHPRYQERFRQLRASIGKDDFNQRFYKLFEADWQALSEEWQLMVANMEYGYDVARNEVDFTPGKPFANAADVTVEADRGWQNSGLQLEAGTTYDLTASGRYQIAKTVKQPAQGGFGNSSGSGSNKDASADQANEPGDNEEAKVPWECEPGGVTIRYYRGQPLGILLAAIRPDHPKPGSTTALLHPIVIGLGATVTPKETGTLFFKVNDSAGELDDNAGSLKVEIQKLPQATP